MAFEYQIVAALAIAAQVYLSPIPEVSTLKVVLAYYTANLILITYLVELSSQFGFVDLAFKFTSLNATFLLTAIALTLIRRLYFSPLCKFPGPKLAAASKLWAANEYRLGRHSLTVKALHKKYNSDFVRIGPNEVSIRNVDAVEKIYKGRYTRGTFYEVGAINGEFNLNTTRDNKVHAVWRRIWEKAFVTGEFKHYNPRVEHHVSVLVKVLQESAGKEVNFSKVMDNLVFDIMSDLSFAHDSGMQEGWGDSAYMDFIHKYMGIVGPVGSLRNLCQLLIYLPQSTDLKSFRDRGDLLLSNRQKLGTSRKDIFRHLLASDSETESCFTQAELNSNANLAIVTGADTTSSTLAQCFMELAKNERVLRKLQAEIDGLKGEITTDCIKTLPYLNGVVNEATRLFNPVPTGVQATVSSQGVTIANVFLPPNIQVQVPHLVLMTDERYFPQPEEFLPERWTAEAEGLGLKGERRAFIPFGYGTHSCVGKQLALNEMRLVIARVVAEFGVVRGESWDEEKFRKEWMDFAVVKIGAVWVRFVERA